MAYIAGISGSGTAGYFVDSNGKPCLWAIEMAWGLPCNAGRWNGGDWQADMDAYFSVRASQGAVSAWWGIPYMNTQIDSTAPFADGRTWDGIYPISLNGTPGTIATGAETVTLNDPFWQRIDYLVASALANNISVLLNMGMSYDWFTGAVFENLSTSQAQVLGTAIANRYPAATCPHLSWAFGDDSNGVHNNDAWFSAFLAGIRSTGDTRMVTMEQIPATNCHVEIDTGAVWVPGGFGMTSTDYNFCYSYDPCYLGVERSYTETGTTLSPVVFGDGVWYGDTDNSTPDRTIRRFTWWALSSGARGIDVTQGPSGSGVHTIWQWGSTAVAELTASSVGPFCTSVAGQIVSYFTSLMDWHKLVPDTGSTFITAGRGTRATSQPPGFTVNYADADTYVTGSITPAGNLAVIYCNSHFSITVNTTKLAAGYGAKWVDPASLAITATAPGSTYDSTPLGNNSAGDPDWVLVLAQPPYATWTVP